jgi:head-tail adaptor
MDRFTIRAGDLRESVTVEVATQQTNEFGEITMTWAPFAKRRAKIQGRRIDERVDSVSLTTVATHEVTMRDTPGIKADMRLVWNTNSSRVLDIVSITDLPRREGHVINCKEQVA